jgi:hypothetical protein
MGRRLLLLFLASLDGDSVEDLWRWHGGKAPPCGYVIGDVAAARLRSGGYGGYHVSLGSSPLYIGSRSPP